MALYDEGIYHLEHMVDMSKKLSERFASKIKIAESTMDGRVLTCEFVIGRSFFDIFEEILEENDKQAVMDLLDDYRDRIYYSATGESDFKFTAGFEEVFGRFDSLETMGLKSSDVTDIDMIFENIIVSDEGIWQLIDYEWTLSFPIPRDYVTYRTLVYLYNSSKIGYIMKWHQVLKWAGISEELEKIYRRMERNFQTFITKGRKTIEEYIVEGEVEVTPLHSLIVANERIDGITAEYERTIEELESVRAEYDHYRRLAEKNNVEYNILRNEYILQQMELDKHRDDLRQMEEWKQREANKHGLKRFFK